MASRYTLVRLAVTGSTQDDARRHHDGAAVLVVADAQTAGRGRSGSVWESAPRAVAMSLAVRPSWPMVDWPLLPLVAGVAAGRVLDCGLKWPNDLMVDAGKVGGILVEAGDGPAVIGMGVNLWWPDAPMGRAALWDEEPPDGEGERVATAWADRVLDLLDAGPRAWPRQDYAARCTTIGSTVTWDPGGHGRAVGIADDGALVVETDEGTRHLRSGEVRHMRSAGESG